MDECDKVRLQKNRSSLLDDLSVDDILIHLIQEDVLTDDDAERIKSEKTRRDRVQKLLSLLPYRGSNAYKEFRAALQKEGAYTWLVEALDKTNVSSASSSSTSSIAPIKELNHQVFRKVSQHLDVIRDWRGFGRALGIDEVSLQEIEYAYSLGGPKEMTYQVLIKWQRTQSQPDAQSLIRILREHGYKYLADDLDGK